jgi:hypothetical protein
MASGLSKTERKKRTDALGACEALLQMPRQWKATSLNGQHHRAHCAWHTRNCQLTRGFFSQHSICRATFPDAEMREMIAEDLN